MSFSDLASILICRESLRKRARSLVNLISFDSMRGRDEGGQHPHGVDLQRTLSTTSFRASSPVAGAAEPMAAYLVPGSVNGTGEMPTAASPSTPGPPACSRAGPSAQLGAPGLRAAGSCSATAGRELVGAQRDWGTPLLIERRSPGASPVDSRGPDAESGMTEPRKFCHNHDLTRQISHDRRDGPGRTTVGATSTLAADISGNIRPLPH